MTPTPTPTPTKDNKTERPTPGGPAPGGTSAAAALVLVCLGLAGLALVPQYPGFWVLPVVLALLILLVRGPKAIVAGLRSAAGPGARKSLAAAGQIVLCLAALLLVGSLTAAPVLNVSAPPGVVLAPETRRLLARLEVPVKFEARLSRRADPGPAAHLLGLYARETDMITVSVDRTEGLAEALDGEIRVADPGSLAVSAEGFQETVSPIDSGKIDEALRRLVSPVRLVYNLSGDGEKSTFDPGHRGLSLWAESLGRSKIYFRDLFFPGPGLPVQAAAADALVLAGPRRPLGPERERALLDYVAGGGRLLVLQDPMVAGLDPSALARFGLNIPWGLVVDPQASWTGTTDYFIVGRDFPSHPVTAGQDQPVVWPLAGALRLAESDGPGAPAEEDVPMLTLIEETGGADGDAAGGDDAGGNDASETVPGPDDNAKNAASADGRAEGIETGTGAGNEDAGREKGGAENADIKDDVALADDDAALTDNDNDAANDVVLTDDDAGEKTDDPAYQTWAIALTSPGAWLETDAASLAADAHVYQAESDFAGPLVLASATSFANGARLAVFADADLAANGFLAYAGNERFLNNTLFWLLGAEDDLAVPAAGGTILNIDRQSARLLFWLPAVIWPMLALAVWRVRHRRRRRG
ncbi:MAG: hypothetical protein LBP95_04825 [Deltaproteobacteria bacterium]|jgi:hypothetical protein|nr:hypothetical protein [Deltaproteobacteria bacterium]